MLNDWYHNATRLSVLMLDRKRHDLLNHIQVLLGYASLNKTEAIRAHLLQMIEELQCESRLSKLGFPEFTLFLHHYPVRFSQLQFEVDVPAEIKLLEHGMDESDLFLVMDWLSLFGQFLDHKGAEIPSLMLTISKDESEITFSADFVGHLNWDAMNEKWETISRNLEMRGSISEKVKSENEWVVEVSFPITNSI